MKHIALLANLHLLILLKQTGSSKICAVLILRCARPCVDVILTIVTGLWTLSRSCLAVQTNDEIFIRFHVGRRIIILAA